MTGIWNWLKKKRGDEELLDEYWTNFETDYNAYITKNVENDCKLSMNETFYLQFTKFCIYCCILVEMFLRKEPEAKEGVYKCFKRACEKEYFGILAGYGRMVINI